MQTALAALAVLVVLQVQHPGVHQDHRDQLELHRIAFRAHPDQSREHLPHREQLIQIFLENQTVHRAYRQYQDQPERRQSPHFQDQQQLRQKDHQLNQQHQRCLKYLPHRERLIQTSLENQPAYHANR